MLLDTHVLVWIALADPGLGRNARARLDKAMLAGSDIAVSAISFWEIGMLVEKGRLAIDPEQTRTQALRVGIREIVVDGGLGIAASQLASFHGDPADRIIVATARQEGLPLLTADRKILGWKAVKTIDATR